MLELGRLNLAGPSVQEALRDADQSLSLPAFSPFIFSAGAGFGTAYDCIWFPPSKPLFDKHFAGKKLDLDREKDTPPEKQAPALFEEIGWHGWQGKLEDEAAPQGK